MPEIEIPSDVFVRCPIKKFSLTRARNCEGCPEFHGLAEMLGGEPSFQRKYTVRCAVPTLRELFHVEGL